MSKPRLGWKTETKRSNTIHSAAVTERSGVSLVKWVNDSWTMESPLLSEGSYIFSATSTSLEGVKATCEALLLSDLERQQRRLGRAIDLLKGDDASMHAKAVSDDANSLADKLARVPSPYYLVSTGSKFRSWSVQTMDGTNYFGKTPQAALDAALEAIDG